ncbi:unnamed protein product [Amoebophrya sp. A25]|nr:unnamed protein product [Amoebophrya sp. A25]|eukprot:GSA25T00006441001.1
MASSTSESSSSAKTAAAKVFTLQEVSAHNRADDLWIAVNGFVYDLTKFVKLHPGGKAVLTAVAGTDATKQFYALHNKTILAKYKRLRIGTLKEAEGKSEK